jgi:hypothetical protein
MAKKRQELGLFNHAGNVDRLAKESDSIAENGKIEFAKYRREHRDEIIAENKAVEEKLKLKKEEQKQNLQQTINKESDTYFSPNLQMNNIYVYIIALVIILVLRKFYQFYRDLKKDNTDLKNSSLKEKFNFLFDGLNTYCYSGKGRYTEIDKRSLSIYEEGSNQILKFQYSTGMLAIEWKYKYYQQEMIYGNNIYDARNVSETEQEQILKNLIEDFNKKLKLHIDKVNKSEIKDTILAEHGITKEQMKKSRDFLNGL